MGLFQQDLKYAFRYLRKHLSFTTIAVVTVALGVGATTAIFSVVNGVLLKGLPYPNSEELIRLWTTNNEAGVTDGDFSAADLIDYKEQSTTFVDLGGYFSYDATFTDTEGNAQKVPAAGITTNMFDLLGVQPILGRGFRDDDASTDPNQPPRSIILAHSVWQNLYDGDPDIIGRSILAEGFALEVIGVTPPGFEFPRGMVAWGPMPLSAAGGRQARFMNGVGRLRANATVDAAALDVGVIASRLEREFQESNRNIGVRISSLHESIVGDLKPALFVLLGAAAVLLLIASVNVANLLLARGVERSTEIAVRTALGAGRTRIIRQLLTESFALAAIGAVVGVGLAAAIVKGIHVFGPVEMDLLLETRIDSRVLLFTVGVTGIAGLMFGMFPALAAGSPNLRSALTEGSKGSKGSGARMRSALVTLELALAVVLVLQAGLLVKSFRNLSAEETGFDPSNSLVAELALPFAGYQDPPSIADFYQRYMDKLATAPGVVSVSAVSSLPFGPMLDFRVPITVRDREPPPRGSEPQAFYRQVTPGFFTNMGIPVVSGRDFERFDRRDSRPVIVINEAFARLVFPDDDPIGKYLIGIPPSFGPLGTFPQPEVEIVGVVKDFKFSDLGESPEPSVFFVHDQSPFRRMTLIVKSRGEPLQLAQTVRADLATLDPTMALGRVETFERVIAGSYARERFSMLLLTGFAIVALSLAAIGIYGVISFSVEQRTTEMAIRMALGAQNSTILKLILKGGSILGVVGVSFGLFGAWAAGRVTASQLYGASPNDPFMFLVVAVGLIGVALLATLVPAIRATKIPPATVLKPE